MVLGEVEETITTIEIDEETFEQIYRVNNKFKYDLLISDVFFFSQQNDKFQCYLYVVMGLY